MKRKLLSEKDLLKKPLKRLLPTGATNNALYPLSLTHKKPEYEVGEIYQSLKHIKSQRKNRRAHTGMPQDSYISRFLKKTHSADSRIVRRKHRSAEDNLCELLDNINKNTKTFNDVE